MRSGDEFLWAAAAAAVLTAVWVTPLVACAKRRDRPPAGWGPLLIAGLCGATMGTAVVTAPLLAFSRGRGPIPPAAAAWALTAAQSAIPLGAAAASLFAFLALLRAWRACGELTEARDGSV